MSNYNSMQVKLEKRFSQGVYGLVSYTLSKLNGERGSQHPAKTVAGRAHRLPYRRFNVIGNTRSRRVTRPTFLGGARVRAAFGTGKRFVDTSSAVVNALVSGWQLSTIYKFQSAPPMYFRSTEFCNVPGQFRARCIPGIIDPGILAQDKGSFDPARGRCSTRTPSSRSLPSTTTLARATVSKRASAASVQEPGLHIDEEHAAARRHEPAAPPGGVQHVELAHVQFAMVHGATRRSTTISPAPTSAHGAAARSRTTADTAGDPIRVLGPRGIGWRRVRPHGGTRRHFCLRVMSRRAVSAEGGRLSPPSDIPLAVARVSPEAGRWDAAELVLVPAVPLHSIRPAIAAAPCRAMMVPQAACSAHSRPSPVV